MTQATTSTSIEIALRGGEQVRGYHHFRPGDEVRATVLLRPDRDMDARHVYVRLQWHTEGRGDRDEGVIDQRDVFGGQLRTMLPESFDVSFTLPESPWSYTGHYVSIIWTITVEIDLAWARNPKHQQPFVMRPRHDEADDSYAQDQWR
jgi:hypothetical protein